MIKGTYLTIEEVAMTIGVSTKTLNFWYAWRRTNPKEKELVKLLPDYHQDGPRQTRYWNQNDLWKLIEFKTKLPRGRNGVMASITQKYIRKAQNNGKEEN